MGSTSSSPGTGRSETWCPTRSASCPRPSWPIATAAPPIVVCPSRSEGFGIVCAEAMAHGKPVVATAVGGLQELVHHARTGFLVEPGNPAALRVAIKLLLADPALRRRLGENARADVAERFAWPAVTQATVEAYRSALGVETAPEPAPLEAAA